MTVVSEPAAPAAAVAVAPAEVASPTGTIPVTPVGTAPPAAPLPDTPAPWRFEPVVAGLAVWAAGFAFLMLRLLAGVALLRRWTRRAEPVADPLWLASLERAAPGRNRIHLVVGDLDAELERLRGAGVEPLGEVVAGPGGRQFLVADPAGNLVELFEPGS